MQTKERDQTFTKHTLPYFRLSLCSMLSSPLMPLEEENEFWKRRRENPESPLLVSQEEYLSLVEQESDEEYVLKGERVESSCETFVNLFNELAMNKVKLFVGMLYILPTVTKVLTEGKKMVERAVLEKEKSG